MDPIRRSHAERSHDQDTQDKQAESQDPNGHGRYFGELLANKFDATIQGINIFLAEAG
jgi:hypothetical protein